MTDHSVITFTMCTILCSLKVFCFSPVLGHQNIRGVNDSTYTSSTAISIDSVQKMDEISPGNNDSSFGMVPIGEDSITRSVIIKNSDSLPEISDSLDVHDTLYRQERINQLLAINAYNSSKFQQYPTQIDSLLHRRVVRPFHIFQSDGMDLFMLFQSHSSFCAVPVALSTTSNTFLFYGYPSFPLSISIDNSMITQYRDPLVGFNTFSLTEIQNGAFTLPPEIHLQFQPHILAKPETNIFIGLGPFNENIATIQFTRPLGQSVNIGIFSNFRSINRQNFSHRRGAIYSSYKSFYKKIGLDTALVMNQGTNPLSKDHISGVRLNWQGKNGATAFLTYSYSDMHNDISSEHLLDSIKDSMYLVWEERSHFSHFVRSCISHYPINKQVQIFGDIFLETNTNKLSPVSEILSKNNSNKGGNFICGGAGKATFQRRNYEEFFFQISVDRNSIERYNKSHWVSHRTKTIGGYSNTFFIKRLTSQLQGKANSTFIKLNGKLEHTVSGSIGITSSIFNQNLSFYFNHGLMPVLIPYDTLFTIIPGNVIDDVQFFGTEMFLQYKKVGFIFGTCLLNDVQKQSPIKNWPKGVAPYKQPRHVYTLMPIFGQWKGFTLSSRWFFSDQKPFVKSRNTISFHFNRPGKALHLFIEGYMDYWSEREKIEYAGIDTWNREIVDYNFKTSVQIKTFRLYYKINNLLNRKNAYVPGYFMPGLVFRYGFTWLLQG